MIHIFQPLYFAICFSWQEFVFIYMNKAKGFLNFGFQKEGMNLLLSSGGLVAKSCLTLTSPWTVACLVPLTVEFSRQEYWSGLPFPSLKVKVTESCPTLCDPHIVHGFIQARILEWVAFSVLQQIFPIQESNQVLLHCRWILYQLSYQGNPLLSSKMLLYL